MVTASKRLLEGRKIVDFDLGCFDDRKGGIAHDPTITLDNGARLRFVTEETDTGDYGVRILYIPKK